MLSLSKGLGQCVHAALTGVLLTMYTIYGVGHLTDCIRQCLLYKASVLLPDSVFCFAKQAECTCAIFRDQLSYKKALPYMAIPVTVLVCASDNDGATCIVEPTQPTESKCDDPQCSILEKPNPLTKYEKKD